MKYQLEIVGILVNLFGQLFVQEIKDAVSTAMKAVRERLVRNQSLYPTFIRDRRKGEALGFQFRKQPDFNPSRFRSIRTVA
jgi:hypothetical protein